MKLYLSYVNIFAFCNLNLSSVFYIGLVSKNININIYLQFKSIKVQKKSISFTDFYSRYKIKIINILPNQI